MNMDRLGVQLYTLRAQTENDMLGVLRQVASIGYRVVEFAGYGNSSPQEIRAVLDELGLRSCSAHVSLDRMEQQIEQVVAELQTLGCEYAVVPWVGQQYRDDIEQARGLAQRLDRVGLQLREHGFTLAYHNHDFEFAPLDNTTMWETLVNTTDPTVVQFELDVYWVDVAGHDPVALIERHADRLKLVHLKDRSTEPGGTFAPVGSGSIPWERIVQAARATDWYIVEQDTSDSPLDDVRRSFEYVRSMNGS